jgi:hypothetical protein
VADSRTTVITSATNAVLFRYNQYLGTVTTSGNYYVYGIRFIQSNAAASFPVVQLDVLGEYSVFEKCDIYQAGTGDGIRCLQLTKATLQFCNVLNRDWNTNGLGNARVGCGINIFDQYNAGLGCVRKCTSRGFLDGYILGYGNFDLGPFLLEDNEASVTYRGMTISALMSKTLVSHNYFEGTELTCITDNGKYTSVCDNELQPGTWTIGINGSAQAGGAMYQRNQIGMSAALSSVIGITIHGTQIIEATVSDNYILWGSNGTGLTNVYGIQLTGIDAMINHEGNMFNPNTSWSGSSKPLSDQTTSSTGSSGSGVIGLGVGFDSASFFPRMERGAYGLWRNPTAFNNTAVAANVLTLGQATYCVLTCTSAQTVNSIAGGACDENHVYVIRVTNGNVTFTAGASIKLSGTASYTPSSAGATITFLMDNNVAWEVSRTAY